MTSTDVEFCDTNILVYAYDLTAEPKRSIARALLDRLWDRRCGAISVQVLQELFVALRRGGAGEADLTVARTAVADMGVWTVIEPTVADVLAAVDASSRWMLSFWDAMILTSARKAGSSVLWSEDLNHGQEYDGVSVRNPFL